MDAGYTSSSDLLTRLACEENHLARWRRYGERRFPALAQLPNSRVTTLAGGQVAAASRSSASPPRRRAGVRDQSQEEGNRPYLTCQSRIAAITNCLLHFGWIAPGLQRLQ